MKHLLVFLFFLTTITISHAQIQQGNLQISTGFSISKNDTESSTINRYFPNGDHRTSERSDISISPSIGYMLSDQNMLGVQIRYSHSKFVDHLAEENIYNTYEVAPFVRRYFPIGDNFYLAGTLSVFRDWTSLADHPTDEYTSTAYGARLSPSITYFLGDHWAASAAFGSLYYRYSESENTTESIQANDSSTQYGLDLHMNSLSFSLSYFIR